jgi:hypothetical protein
MYVPAERNFLSIVDKPGLLKNLPNTLYTFLDEYENAKKNQQKDLSLPFIDLYFSYDKSRDVSSISGPAFKIKLSEAASGLQSAVPLYVVSSYLAHSIDAETDPSVVEKSVMEKQKLRMELESIFSDEKLNDEMKKSLIEMISSRLKNSHFINIVEEPEQNLFPDSQKLLLFELIKFANMRVDDKLIITTHSPYLINYLSLVVKAKDLSDNLIKGDKLRERLNSVVPPTAHLLPEDLSIYEVQNDGTLTKVKKYHGIPSDENTLNMKLAETNDDFIKLLEIEDQCR